jgi:hypothetical protein
MKGGLAEEIFALIEARLDSKPTPMEFEMAYQPRLAIDRIRFAIKHTEQFGPHTDHMRDAGFQLLDALQRLEAVDRRFQARCRVGLEHTDGKQSETRPSHPARVAPRKRVNGSNVLYLDIGAAPTGRGRRIWIHAICSGLAHMSSAALEKHYRVRELAALWGFSDNTIIRMFASEPGVVRLESGAGRRKYTTLSIAESVALRVHERLSHKSPRRSFRLGTHFAKSGIGSPCIAALRAARAGFYGRGNPSCDGGKGVNMARGITIFCTSPRTLKFN